MTHRERILTALRHKEPDRVPLDLASHNCSGITAGAHARLRAHLGIPPAPPPVIAVRWLGTVVPDEAILHRFDVDGRPLLLGPPEIRPERELADGSLVNEWGITFAKHGESHYFPSDGPFCRLDEPALKDLETYSWPVSTDPGRFRNLRERAKALHENTDYAVVLSVGAGPVHVSQWVRGFGEWLSDLLLNPTFSEGLIDRITDFWIEVAHHALEEAGEYVDIVNWGDDLATQRGPQFSPELYRRMIKPRQKRMVEAVKRYGKPVVYHTCGSVVTLIPDLIELGIDALNPVQVSAAGMDTKRLKREFGRDMAFWGAIDTQAVLPRGTPQDVRDEVRRRIEDLAPGGGYILCAVHNIQPDVPPENIVAMYEAALEYASY